MWGSEKLRPNLRRQRIVKRELADPFPVPGVGSSHCFSWPHIPSIISYHSSSFYFSWAYPCWTKTFGVLFVCLFFLTLRWPTSSRYFPASQYRHILFLGNQLIKIDGKKSLTIHVITLILSAAGITSQDLEGPFWLVDDTAWVRWRSMSCKSHPGN